MDKFEVIQQQDAGLPPRVSYTQMSAFQQCPLRFYFTYVDGWREPPTSALVAGNIAHAVIEDFYRLEPTERTQERASELLREIGNRMLARADYRAFSDDFALRQTVKEAVGNLFSIENPREVQVDPAHLEMELSIAINGVPFFGKVDRYTNTDRHVVTDYKTGKWPGKFIDGKLDQPFLYALAFKLQHDIDIDEIQLIFLNARQDHRQAVTQSDLARVSEALVDMRGAAEASLDAAAWEARPGNLCGWCPFRGVCPAMEQSAPIPGSEHCADLLRNAGLTQRRN